MNKIGALPEYWVLSGTSTLKMKDPDKMIRLPSNLLFRKCGNEEIETGTVVFARNYVPFLVEQVELIIGAIIEIPTTATLFDNDFLIYCIGRAIDSEGFLPEEEAKLLPFRQFNTVGASNEVDDFVPLNNDFIEPKPYSGFTFFYERHQGLALLPLVEGRN